MIAAYHTGDPPDSRTLATLEANGIHDFDHEARRVCRRLTHSLALYLSFREDLFLPPRGEMVATAADETIAKQFRTADFDKFDYIFAMDRSNLSDLQRLQRGNPDARAKVMLFGEWSGNKTGKAEIVSDPYYGGSDGFDKAFEQCSRFSRNFLKEVLGE